MLDIAGCSERSGRQSRDLVRRWVCFACKLGCEKTAQSSSTVFCLTRVYRKNGSAVLTRTQQDKSAHEYEHYGARRTKFMVWNGHGTSSNQGTRAIYMMARLWNERLWIWDARPAFKNSEEQHGMEKTVAILQTGFTAILFVHVAQA